MTITLDRPIAPPDLYALPSPAETTTETVRDGIKLLMSGLHLFNHPALFYTMFGAGLVAATGNTTSETIVDLFPDKAIR